MIEFVLVLLVHLGGDEVKSLEIARIKDRGLCEEVASQLNDHPKRGGTQYLYCQEVTEV